MKHSIFGYLLGEGFRNVFHNKKSSGASLAIMCATMLIFGLFFMIIENLNNAVETLETQQGIQVFIQKTATDAQMEQIGEQIQAIDGVNKVTFVSKEDALNQTKEKLKDKQALIAGWDESNPFKASYLVTLTDLKLSSQVQDEIKKIYNSINVTIVFITHDIKEALKLGTKVLVMDAGKILRYDTPENIVQNPNNDFVSRLIGVD